MSKVVQKQPSKVSANKKATKTTKSKAASLVSAVASKTVSKNKTTPNKTKVASKKETSKVKPTITSKQSKSTVVATSKVKPTVKKVKTVLITQPRPESDKSPYFALEKKYDIVLDFCPFILVEGVSSNDFRKQRVDITQLTAIIFNSRNAIDHFFRICDELKIKISPEMKYFCITESIALYLQKFILYRKRKIFYGLDGTVNSMLEVIVKHKTKEKYIVPVNDICRTEILECLQKNELEYTEVVLYKTVVNDVRSLLKKAHDMIVFFTPGGVKALFENQPKFSQKDTLLGAFGPITTKAVEDAGLNLQIKAPMPNAPSMVSAIDLFLSQFIKK